MCFLWVFNSSQYTIFISQKLCFSSLSFSVCVSVVVNISRSQILFTSLVSVNVEKAQLMDQVLLDKSVLATHPHCDYKKAAGGPSSLLFISSNLLRQKPLPPEEEPSINKLCPSPRPAHLTFDLYRRQRKWEVMP